MPAEALDPDGGMGFSLVERSLAWTVRYARSLLASGVFIGLFFPEFASLLRPWVTPAVVGTLAAALVRLDWQRLAAALADWRVACYLCTWQLLISPWLVWLLLYAIDAPQTLMISVVLQAAAPPIGSAPVFALLLGIDASLTVLVTVLAILLLPLTLTPLVAVLAANTSGMEVSIDWSAFFWRVTLFVLMPFAIAALVRAALGIQRLKRHDDSLAAINLLLLLVFAIGVMDGVSAYWRAQPEQLSLMLGAACAVAILLHALAYGLFRIAGSTVALTAAICSGNRNMGLLLAITAGFAGEAFSVYVGIAQIPMYLAPLLLAALIRVSR